MKLFVKLFNFLFSPKEPECPHLRVLETMACDAVCRDCGKNLGFIQKWRDTTGKLQGAKEQYNDPTNPACWRK